MSELFPRPRRRKRQPSADLMREQLTLAAEEIIRLRLELAAATKPRYRAGAAGWVRVNRNSRHG